MDEGVPRLEDARDEGRLDQQRLDLLGAARRRCVDLLALVLEQRESSRPLVGAAAEPVLQADELAALRTEAEDVAVVDRTGAVEQLARGALGAQDLVLVLAVQLAQRRPACSERLRRGELAVDRRSQAARRRPLADEHDLSALGVHEHRRSTARAGVVSNREPSVLAAEDEVQRLDEQ